MLTILKNRRDSEHTTEPKPSTSTSPLTPSGLALDPATRTNQLPPNRLTISTISELLELRKSHAISSQTYQTRAQAILKDYSVEPQALESIFTHLNTATVQLVQNPDPEKHEPFQVVSFFFLFWSCLLSSSPP